MAALTTNTSNTIRCFGSQPSDKWGVMLWGDMWGQGTNAMVRTIGKPLNNSETMTNSVSKFQIKLVSNSQGLANAMINITDVEKRGWYRVYPDNTNNVANIIASTYSSVPRTSSTYTAYGEPGATSVAWTSI